jgi:hypothetical protein
MSSIWNILIECKDNIIKEFDLRGREIQEPGMSRFNQPENGWINRVWETEHCRRCHIDVVDARQSKGLWMMHVCVFPHLHNNGPIYGFDVIAGEHKMTGAFHDFSRSSGGENHPLIEWYHQAVSEFVPTKKRKLPEWALNIFSGSMIAAGNVQTDEEATAIVNLAVNNLQVYFDSIGQYAHTAKEADTIEAQNYYCHNQQQNPHTPRVMKSLGLAEADVELFCTDALFPKIR